MTTNVYVFPNWIQLVLSQSSAAKYASTPDSIMVGLIASGSVPTTSGNMNSTVRGYTYVSDFLANAAGSALTEVTGGSYSRQALTSVNFTTSSTNDESVLTAANPSWGPSATFSAVYAFFYDNTAGSPTLDSQRRLIAYWDFGGTQSCSSGTFTLQLGSSPRAGTANTLVSFDVNAA